MSETEVQESEVGERNSKAREMVLRLIESAKMTPQDIAEAMEERVSPRTIYRWAKGESEPQNEADLKCLEQLVESRC